MKEIVIGIYYKGKRYPFRVSAFKDNVGKFRPSQDTIEDCLNSIGVGDNDSYTIGA